MSLVWAALAELSAIAQHGPAAAEDAVHRLREARSKRLHSPSERRRPIGLDDRVEVVVLDRELEEPERAALGAFAERSALRNEGSPGMAFTVTWQG